MVRLIVANGNLPIIMHMLSERRTTLQRNTEFLLVPPNVWGSMTKQAMLIARYMNLLGFKARVVPQKVVTISHLRKLAQKARVIIILGALNDRLILSPKTQLLINIARSCGKQLVFYLTCEGPIAGLAQHLFPKIVKLSNALVLCPSRFVAKQLRAIGIHADVVPHGVDLELYCKVRETVTRTEEKVRVLTVAANVPRKGVKLLLRVLKLCLNQNPSLRSKLEIILKLNPGDQLPTLPPELAQQTVIIREHLNELELARLYAMATIFVHPAFAEGFGVPLIEALTQGVPVVCLNAPPMNEVVSEEVGFLVEVARAVLVRCRHDTYELWHIPNMKSYIETLLIALEDEKARGEKAVRAIEYAKRYDFRTVFKSPIYLLQR